MSDTYKYKVCKCGDKWIDHKSGSPFTWTMGVASGACRLCDCKRFRSAGKMTWEESAKFKEAQCSLSQPPTSGTSQSPSPSASPDLSLMLKSLTVSSPYPPFPSVKVFQPETRLTPVVGFRSWHARPFHKLGVGPSFLLGSYNDQFGVWKAGRNEARCHARGGGIVSAENGVHDQVPSAGCTCGFYVLTDFDSVPFYPDPNTAYFGSGGFTISAGGNAQPRAPMMVGAVVGWGRVVQHGGEGWRAEFAQVIALLDCKVSDEHLASTHQVAEAYGVPVVGRKALELMAAEYGDALRLPVGAEKSR